MEEDFARPDESTRLVDCANEFRIHIQSFLARTTDIETREVLSGRSTWEDIQREASEALVKYQNDGKTWRHPFQTAGRAFSSVSSRLEFLLELLPNGDYGSLLFAGLRLVFNAAKRMQAIRESVMKSFSSLSETIDSTYHYIRVYSGDYILRQRSEDLYIAILEAVRGVTIWLTANPLAQSFKAFFQQNDYGKKLEAKMTTSIQDKASKFEERVQVLLHIKVQNIDQNVISVKHDITEVISDLREKGTTMASLEEMLRGLKLDLDWNFNNLTNRVGGKLSASQQIPNQNLNAMTNMIFLSRGSMKKPSIISMKQLVDILDSDLTMSQSKQDNHIPAIHIRDSALLGSFGGTLMPKPKEYIFDVANKQEFRDWYLTAKSQTIIINDMKMNSLSQNALSPMSYMCHEFMKPPSRDKDRLEDNIGKPFVFYCGLHSSPEDEFYGAEGILRSFIIQLLEAYGHKIDLSFLDPIAIQELQAHYVPRLQSLLEKIMYGIGVGVVFLLIDGISWYERDAQIEKTTMVMSFLGDLVEKMEARQTGLILKPLITTTGFNRRARMWFPNAIELFM